ncbi:hypothetical protein JVT61DRAFT_1782 [Boletus reticuloceps]|uniref:Uncharacterized protein n=1 Tax=Boletus reticuloceps TaxID=495285 RepID=A0A8I3ABX4_9AGAM|nr:hypothetical protein JVT61DRAFT_1782 [Boletus reticuloceps]
MSSSSSGTKKEEFKQLPKAFKQLQFHVSDKILRTATTLRELPSILIPSNDRRVPFPPLVHYGYPLQIERMHELLAQKLGAKPGILDANPFGVLVHLQREVFYYGIQFQAVYLDGTDSMFFIAVSSNWDQAPADRLEEVVKRLKDFFELDEEPVWCLDARKGFWRRWLMP